MSKQTDYRFKILYAFAIIMVVIGHAPGGITFFSDWFPYAGAHLAIFMFCSGYFYKYYAENHPGKYIWKKVKKLLIPMYIYTLAYGILVQILRLKGFTMGSTLSFKSLIVDPITSGHEFIYNMGGWYLIPLFMIEAYNICIRKLLNTVYKKRLPEPVYFVISIALGMIGNHLAEIGLNKGWWLVLVRMLYFLPFFAFGTFFKQTAEKYYKKIPSFWLFIGIFVIKLILIYPFNGILQFTPSWCADFSGGPLMPIVTGLLAIIFYMRIADILCPVIGQSKWINLVADNTFSIMINQFAGFMLVKTFYAAMNRFFGRFPDFDWGSYKSNIWWYYVPKGLNYYLVIYYAAGIAVPILIQMIINRCKQKIHLMHA